LMVYP
jgi:hypothetical protein